MATGGDLPELGGYDYEFTSKVPEDWKCPICRLTLKDPVQIVGCGHRLCSICKESLMSCPSPTCPADRQPLADWKIFPDNGCHRQILDLTVKCSHSRCSWTGELRAVEKHQSECLFKVVKCSHTGCSKIFIKWDVKTHETFECSWRRVDCEYCQQLVIMNQKQKHFDICPKFPVLCTNKCGARDIPREKLEAHVRDECPAREVQCEFKNLGCEAVFPRSDATSHSQTQIENHLKLVLRGLEATQHQVHELLTGVKDQSKQIERQSQHIERQTQQIGRQSQHIKRQSQQIERQSQQLQLQSQHIERLLSKEKKQSEKMERSLSTVRDQPPQRERRGPINQIFPTPFEWKIFVLRTHEQSLVSEPFYLFSIGYKYILKIETALFGLFCSLSVFIKVVPGEFDEYLSWPCKEKVRVTLVNNPLLDNREYISEVIDFEKGKKPWSRPLRDDHHKYRPILSLRDVRFVCGSYTDDDTILIRAIRE